MRNHIEKVYDKYTGLDDLIFSRILQRGREMAPGLLEIFSGARLLEAGVGTGLSLRYLPADIEVTGIDISKTMLDVAHRRVESMNDRTVHLCKMDAGHLAFPDNSFDRVLAAYFISTVPDPVQVMFELKRVCRPGGYMVFLNHFLHRQPIVKFLEKAVSPICFRLGFRTDLDMDWLLQASGLEVETLAPIDSNGHWKALRCVNPAKK
jgi:phosphatidylethanolamine/phosphatidyl-N-methylethanolamine N-methyltransferase